MFRSLGHFYIRGFSGLNREVWLLALGMLINRSGTMVLMFASLFLTRDKGFSMEHSGAIMAFFGAGSIIGSFAGGWLTDRWRPLPVMLGSLLLSGLLLISLPFLDSAIPITAVIFFYALIADMYRPANSAAMVVASTSKNRTRSITLLRLATNLGFSIGPAIGGFLALWYGYTFVFLLDAGTSLMACLVLFLAFRSRFDVQKKREPMQASSVKKTTVYRDYTYLVFILLVALYGTCFFQLFATMPQYFKLNCGFSEDLIGILLALNGFVVVVVEMPLVASLESKKYPFSLIVLGVLFFSASFLLLLAGGCSLELSVLYTILISFSEILAMPFMMNFALSRGGEQQRGQYAALYSVAYGFASMLAPALGLGFASRFGFTRYFQFFIALSVFNAICFYILRRYMRKNRPD